VGLSVRQLAGQKAQTISFGRQCAAIRDRFSESLSRVRQLKTIVLRVAAQQS